MSGCPGEPAKNRLTKGHCAFYAASPSPSQERRGPKKYRCLKSNTGPPNCQLLRNVAVLLLVHPLSKPHSAVIQLLLYPLRNDHPLVKRRCVSFRRCVTTTPLSNRDTLLVAAQRGAGVRGKRTFDDGVDHVETGESGGHEMGGSLFMAVRGKDQLESI